MVAYGESFDCLSRSTMHTWVKLFFSFVRILAMNQAAQRLPKFLQYPFLALYLPPKTREQYGTVVDISKVSSLQPLLA